MGNKVSLAVLLLMLFLTSLVILLPHTTVKAVFHATIIVPDNYPTIQAAIDNASAGDTIFVRNGTYNQTITINKPISLIGENAQTTILTIPIIYNPPILPLRQVISVITINADNVNINGFTIINPNSGAWAVYSNGDEDQLTNLQITPTTTAEGGIYASGSNLYISHNYITPNEGLDCDGSYNQIVENTILESCSVSGSYNSLTDNTFSGEIALSNINSSITNQNTFENGSLTLTNSDSNMIYNNTINGGAIGMGVGSGAASNNLVVGNTIEGSGCALGMGYGSNNIFYGNLLTNNANSLSIGGTNLEVDNNLFYYNMFINNAQTFEANWQVIGTNAFDNGSVGNYWSDYLTKYPNAAEIDNSGIWNAPYIVYNNVTDNYPLMAPFDLSSITVQLPQWVNNLPTQLSVPAFPLQNTPATTPASPTASPSANSSVPELSWLVIVPLLLSMFSVAVIVRHRSRC
jgi:nitrous oxidase accessory protein